MRTGEAPVTLALGTNEGDRASLLARGRELLARRALTRLSLRSPVVESEPLGPDQPRYLNQVVTGSTFLPPLDLLRALKNIERALGRVPGDRWGPRPIDIDILDYDGSVIELPGLSIPHRGISLREFVLFPWSCVTPEYRVPGLDRTVAELLTVLTADPSRSGRVVKERAP